MELLECTFKPQTNDTKAKVLYCDPSRKERKEIQERI